MAPSLTRSDLLEDGPWFKIAKTATGQGESCLLKDQASKDLDDEETVEVDNVVFHVGRQMITETPLSSTSVASSKISTTSCLPAHLKPRKISKRKKVKKEFLDDSGDEAEERIWNHGWIIDEERLDSFDKKLDLIMKEMSLEGQPILALVRAKDRAAEEKDKVKEEHVDKMIQFMIKVYSKYLKMKEHHPDLSQEESLTYLWNYHQLDHQEFMNKVAALERMKRNEVPEDDPISDDEDIDEALVKFNTQEISSNAAVVGSGPKIVQYFYQDISFPPVGVKDDKEAVLVMALVNHCAKEFSLRRGHGKVKPTVNVSLAKDNLPIAVVKHIKACFTKKWMRLYRPGRRTHKGVKRSEKVPSSNPSTFLQEEPFIPPVPASVSMLSSPFKDAEVKNDVVSDSLDEEELESNPREYFLRSLLPKLNATTEASRKPLPMVSSGVVEDHPEDTEPSSIMHEPERIVDIDALRKKKKPVVDDVEEEFDFAPDEEEYQVGLEAEVFGAPLPKAIKGKGPRKGASDREKGRGGRNEILRNKILEEKLLTGVDYLLDPTNDQFKDSIPDFKAMFKPAVKRKALKLEDLDEDDEDEEYKAVGVPKPKGGVARRMSKRLKMAEVMKESGEYFRPFKDEYRVDISVEDDEL